jgi:hypothetical protein
VFDRFPALQIIVGHNFEILSWSAWRMDYSFPPNHNGGLKRTIKEYLRENFYGGILCGEYVDQEPGAMDKSWSLYYQAYLGMANTVGIDRVVVTTDYPYGDMKAARQFFDQMPINVMKRRKSRTSTRSACSVSGTELLLGKPQNKRIGIRSDLKYRQSPSASCHVQVVAEVEPVFVHRPQWMRSAPVRGGGLQALQKCADICRNACSRQTLTHRLRR